MSRNPAAFDGTQTGGSPAPRGPDQLSIVGSIMAVGLFAATISR
jgi:hypothetical protein